MDLFLLLRFPFHSLISVFYFIYFIFYQYLTHHINFVVSPVWVIYNGIIEGKTWTPPITDRITRLIPNTISNLYLRVRTTHPSSCNCPCKPLICLWENPFSHLGCLESLQFLLWEQPPICECYLLKIPDLFVRAPSPRSFIWKIPYSRTPLAFFWKN